MITILVKEQKSFIENMMCQENTVYSMIQYDFLQNASKFNAKCLSSTGTCQIS